MSLPDVHVTQARHFMCRVNGALALMWYQLKTRGVLRRSEMHSDGDGAAVTVGWGGWGLFPIRAVRLTGANLRLLIFSMPGAMSLMRRAKEGFAVS